MRRIVTLLTDFGTRDHYVATLKAVLLTINPALNLVDITHDIAPQNIQEGGFVLASSFQFFPAGTLHLAVVDPGVGGERQGLAAATERHIFVGPDNGIFDRAFALDPPRLVVSLQSREYQLSQPSATFHGRDIFAPATAHLSLGLPLERLGPSIRYRMIRPGRVVFSDQGEVHGEIIHIDRFGNLISNIEIPFARGREGLQDLQVHLPTLQVFTGPSTYEEAPPSRPFALIGSTGHLEVAVRNGSAHELTGHGVGSSVVVRRRR
ncbi:MAG: SAM-dependent chlorinase/fluorinase [Deltaproteobacteria bacterium]|nr:MAG: SAM-dependent chlorinase/fluorinase [Deltaproteobacteria bacterium]